MRSFDLWLIVFVVVFLLPTSSWAAATLTATQIVGSVKFDGHGLKTGDSIDSEGTIEVASDGHSLADLKYPNGHQLRIKAGGQLKITNSGSLRLKSLALLRGQGFFHFIKNTDAQDFKISTKGAVAGVRGTKFQLEEKDGSTYLCVCEGEVQLTQTTGQAGQGSKLVHQGQDLWAKPGQALAEPRNSEQMSKMAEAEFASMNTAGGFL